MLPTPPTTTAAGDRYLIAATNAYDSYTGVPTDAWIGKLGQIAIRNDDDTDWEFEEYTHYPDEQLVICEKKHEIWWYKKGQGFNKHLSSAKSRLHIRGQIPTQFATHGGVADFSSWTFAFNEGDGFTINNDNTITINRSMLVAGAFTVESAEGANIQLWPRCFARYPANIPDRLVAQDRHPNSKAGLEIWQANIQPFRFRARTRLEFQNRVDQNFPRPRTAFIHLAEL